MLMEAVHEDMQCTNHPYRNSAPGGICAFCLQEKLGKLVSSSLPVAIFPSSPSSSDTSAAGDVSAAHHHLASSSVNGQNVSTDCKYHGYYSRRSRLPFVSTQEKKKNKKKKDGVAMGSSDSSSIAIAFKRSKSTVTPRRGMHFLDENLSDDYSPHRRGFWSFLHMSKTSKKSDKTLSFSCSSVGREKNETSKVSRSRSVGCGSMSMSFSGDRISTECSLRRVESEREGNKPKGNSGQERVRCGGIFGGFIITSSSSDNSSIVTHSSTRHMHARSKSWGWPLASPIRAFTKPRENNLTPNLAAIPSLLAVTG